MTVSQQSTTQGRTGAASPFVVFAEFEVKPECLGDFLALACDDAGHSLADGPGCRKFDVVRLDERPARVMFYEVYDDRAAFDAHLQTSHLARFRTGFPALIVAEKVVRFCCGIQS